MMLHLLSKSAIPDLERGLCRNEDPELFHPVGRSGSPVRTRSDVDPQVTAAKAVCARCPERLACLAWALERDEAGIWGGTTEDERKAMKA